ncbi:MAG: hypothetical protein Q9187_004860 [Circinaria calcarea]
MPISTQISLSVELVKLAQHLPLPATISALISSVRDFKRSSSDFLVEEDLMAIFGRGRVVRSMENHFRDVIKAASIDPPSPLYWEADIVLDAGAGPTLRRALRDGHSYMATVIQLSFLGSMHEETTLAATLTECMFNRYEKGVQDATPDPDYAGVLGTLQACTSQTCQYPWEVLIALVESKFPQSAPWFRAFKSPLNSLSPNLLLGAMDYLYLVQSLPEDRIMVVENQMGLVPIAVWAHCILGLRVFVKDSPDGDVNLGTPGNPQVIIHWSQKWELYPDREWEIRNSSIPRVYLLDAGMEVLLVMEPNDHEAVKIEGLEYHRLKGYGTTFLRRLFNKESIVNDDDSIYAEVAQYVMAVAIVISKSMHRIPFKRELDQTKQYLEQYYMKIESTRILESGGLLLSGIEFDRKGVNGYVERLTSLVVKDMPVPPTRANGARMAIGKVLMPEDSDIWFEDIMAMMLGDVGALAIPENRDDYFLISHKGWSMYHSNIGDVDPGGVDCESICIRRGVPTNLRTKERKLAILDAPRIWPKQTHKAAVVDRGESFLPRCVSPVIKRTELYSSRGKVFWLSIRYDIDDLESLQGFGNKGKFSIYTSYHQLHDGLCMAMKTEPCMHHTQNSKLVQLSLGVVTTKGFDWVNYESIEERICLNLVKGDSRARWVLLGELIFKGHPVEVGRVHSHLQRRVMLRCNNCCENCAIKQASAREGKWLIIL